MYLTILLSAVKVHLLCLPDAEVSFGALLGLHTHLYTIPWS